MRIKEKTTCFSYLENICIYMNKTKKNRKIEFVFPSN